MEGLYREHRIAEKGHLYHFPPPSLSSMSPAKLKYFNKIYLKQKRSLKFIWKLSEQKK